MATWFKIVASLVAVIGAVVWSLHLLFFDVWRVPADDPLLAASIEPTLSAGDLVVAKRHPTVSRGDLLRCADPEAAGRFVIARAIGHPDDHIEVIDEIVSIDGKRTPSPRACDTPIETLHDPRSDEDVSLACSIEEYGDRPFSTLRERQHPERLTKETIETGQWFLVSDNRHIHLDSRDYGQIDPTSCQHVVFRIVSAGGLGDGRRRLSIIW